MEETGVLENLSLLSYVLPDFDPSLKQCQIVPNSAISTALYIIDPLRGISCPPGAGTPEIHG
jgi:hypothetical protein